MPETELGEVEGANEAVDRPNRIVRTDIVLDPRRKQTGLLAALAALERAIRHKPNRTCCSRKCPQFLPSLVGQINGLTRVSHPMRGADRDRHERAVGCGGRDGGERRTPLSRTAKSCGPDAPVLASSFAEISA